MPPPNETLVHSTGTTLRTLGRPLSLSRKKDKGFLYGHRRCLFLLLIPLSLLLTELATRNPQVVERVFSRGVYRGFTAVLGRLFGVFPFSVVEMLIYIIVLAAAGFLAVGGVRFSRRPDKGRGLADALIAAVGSVILGTIAYFVMSSLVFTYAILPQILRLPIVLAVGWVVTQLVRSVFDPGLRRVTLSILSTLGCVAGIAFFLFTVFCGLNYHRVTFADQSGLVVRGSTTDELAALYTELVEASNALRPLVTTNEKGEMSLSHSSMYQMGAKASQAMSLAAEDYEVLRGYTPRAKPVLASRAMSAMDITGIYIPYTFEGNVNVDVPHYYIPFSSVHELAHFKGFMREDEANFIAYLGCREMEDVDYRYSGTVLAMIQTGNALYAADADRYYEINVALSEDIRQDFAASAAYWKQFEGPVAEVAAQMNDTYLKSNGQADGTRSYGRMVDLLLADYRQRHGLD